MLLNLKSLLIAAMLSIGAIAPAIADYVWSGNGNAVTLRDKQACTNAAILEQVKPQFHEHLRAGELLMGSEKSPLCWIQDEQGNVHLIAEEGYVGAMSGGEFRPLKEV